MNTTSRTPSRLRVLFAAVSFALPLAALLASPVAAGGTDEPADSTAQPASTAAPAAPPAPAATPAPVAAQEPAPTPTPAAASSNAPAAAASGAATEEDPWLWLEEV